MNFIEVDSRRDHVIGAVDPDCTDRALVALEIIYWAEVEREDGRFCLWCLLLGVFIWMYTQEPLEVQGSCVLAASDKDHVEVLIRASEGPANLAASGDNLGTNFRVALFANLDKNGDNKRFFGKFVLFFEKYFARVCTAKMDITFPAIDKYLIGGAILQYFPESSCTVENSIVIPRFSVFCQICVNLLHFYLFLFFFTLPLQSSVIASSGALPWRNGGILCAVLRIRFPRRFRIFKSHSFVPGRLYRILCDVRLVHG